MKFIIVAHTVDGFGHVIGIKTFGPFDSHTSAEAWAEKHVLKTNMAGKPVEWEVALLRTPHVEAK